MTNVPTFRAQDASLIAAGVVFRKLQPLIDGLVPDWGEPLIETSGASSTLTWSTQEGSERSFTLTITSLASHLRFEMSLTDAARVSPASIGLRIGRADHVRRYLRHGYTSWDGSYFVELASARGLALRETGALTGHAMTAVLAADGEAAVLGFLRHDRYQSRLRFDFEDGPLSLDLETLLDGASATVRFEAEPLVLLAGPPEETMRAWAQLVAAACAPGPRVRDKRISGWCSWYNLYASITETSVLEHLRAAASFRDRHGIALEVFQIDDGFTPEMGDWLEVKPQFPRGMAPLLAQVVAAGFTPGLWIAPLMVGNRSRLYAEHPDWVVRDGASGAPLAQMRFYGEFRWHKRSEEYYVLDVTHPGAEAYLRQVFRTWRRDWGCGYFKTDFMHFGCDYDPQQVSRYQQGLSRIEAWMRLVRLIRDEIGDALWLGSGAPLWAPIGWMDAVRIGRDIGVSWKGGYSAESLLRDQAARNFANGVLWQADPDCILLRDRFHHLQDDEVRSLALFAGLAGGVIMTSDQLEEVSPERARLFTELARTRAQPCEFPLLGQDTLTHSIGVGHTGQPVLLSQGDPVIIQRVRQADGGMLLHVFNTADESQSRLIANRIFAPCSAIGVETLDDSREWAVADEGVRVRLRPHASCRFLFPAS